MASKFCVSCGTPLAGSRFCTKCGQPSPAQNPPAGVQAIQPGAYPPGPSSVHVPGPPVGVAVAPEAPTRLGGRGVGLVVGAMVVLLGLIAVGVGVTVLFTRSDRSEKAVGPPTAAVGVATPAPSSSNAGTPSGSPSAVNAMADPDNLDCSGQFVVVFNLTNDERDLDTSQPWLEAENSCSGIDRTLGGKPLRLNYVGPYDSADDACQQLLLLDPHSDYVKLLRADQSEGRHYLCSCDVAASELPYLSDSGGAYPQSKTEFRAAVDLHLMLKRVQGFESDNLGLYGKQTTEAVSTYQSDQGLPPTGEVDQATWSQLLASSTACPT